ncbi:hypothetical protein ASG72_00785 [Bosea sp. Leaf344]|uniref:cytochrome c oxidase subunit II n=1 Tax=Bosea sp. Leaf344 TaxID=1736346 RepID=UPI0006F9A341|nr:cytochrome c oxidase subunit II [Bosea sp. Leaf344]KQU54222.1 hypothetical protein ASG72_00785 [Bosea sp. Leaf344]
MRFLSRTLATVAASAIVAGAATLAPEIASAGTGQPTPWQLNLQGPVTEVAAYINWFHDWLNVIIFAISIFVLALLVYVAFRFNEKRNPTPSRTTHNALLEVAWTVIPVLILVVIAIPSFRLLKLQLEIPQADITVKVTGKQWYWSYEYPQAAGAFGFDSLMLDEAQRAEAISSNKITAAEAPRLLAVDNEAVVPVGKVIRVQVTGADVIHKFTVPSFGIKIDAIPGRLNETWFRADREGIYYGQCSFICGQNHAFMPIAFRVVSAERYAAWLEESKKKFANASDAGSKVATASE